MLRWLFWLCRWLWQVVVVKVVGSVALTLFGDGAQDNLMFWFRGVS